MVDIAASLSLTSTSQGVDPAAVLGAETADNQAFGDILAGRMAGQGTAPAAGAATAAPISGLPLPAGNRQPGGKILPDAVAALPDAAAGSEAATAQAATAPAETPAIPTAVRIAAPVLKALETPQAEEAEPAPAKAAETAPAPILVRMLAQAARGPRATDKEEAASDQDAAAADGDADAGQAAAAETAVTVPVLDLPALPVIVAAATQAAVDPAAAKIAPGGKAPALPQAVIAGQAAAAAPQPGEPTIQVAPNPSVPAPSIQNVAANAPAQAAAPAAPAAPAVPVLTVPAAPADTAPAVVTVVPAQAQPQAQLGGQAVTARIKVAAKAADGQPAAAADPAEPAAPALRAALADRAPAVAPEPTAPTVPLAADGQAQAAPAAPAATAATAGLPRHDFAALVDRLIEARNASATNTVHASVNHAEFGRVSLQFQQDGKDLSVAMSSADPEFAVAVQAAMPAERAAANADTGSRGQGQSQAQAQAQAQSGGHSNHAAAGQRGAEAAADQQNRNGQQRNPRGGAETSNPSRRWAEREQPEARGGIFA